MMNNTEVQNNHLPVLTANIAQWHHDRNLIDEATDWSQTKKYLEEFVELVAAQKPGATPLEIMASITDMLFALHREGRIKTVDPLHSKAAMKDALGDMEVVGINIAERNGWTKAECLAAAWGEIKHRKGEMRNGVFVKEDDL